MNEKIIGYQYSTDNYKLIGEYIFPNNMDKEEIHLPPFTTLIKPPENDHRFDIFFNENNWEYRNKVNDFDMQIPEIKDYNMITQGFIDHLKEIGHWTNEHQEKYEIAKATEIKPIPLEDTQNGN